MAPVQEQSYSLRLSCYEEKKNYFFYGCDLMSKIMWCYVRGGCSFKK